jgi:hypothetical protein
VTDGVGSDASSTAASVGSWLRSFFAALAVTLGLVCMTLSPVAIWSRNLVLNTDRYVSTLEPLASDPGVQQVVVNLVTKEVSNRLDVTELVSDVFPKLGQAIGPTLQSTVDSYVRTTTTRFVESPNFEKLWVGMNRAVHTQIVYALTGKSPDGARSLQFRGGKIVLDLSRVVEAVEKKLGGIGVFIASNVPAVGPTLQIANLQGLERAQVATRRLNTLANVLPWIGLVLLAVGIGLSRRRLRTLTISGIGVAVGMLLLLILAMVGRYFYLSGVPPSVVPRDTATFIYDTLLRYFRLGVRLVFVVAALVGLIGWLSGPGERAGRVREVVLRAPRVLGAKVESGRVGPFVSQHVAALRAVIGVAALGVFVVSDNPTGATVLAIAALALVLLVVLEVLRAMARPADS